MKVSNIISALIKGVGVVSIIIATCITGMFAYVYVDLARTGRSTHV